MLVCPRTITGLAGTRYCCWELQVVCGLLFLRYTSAMGLNAFVAEKRSKVFAELEADLAPSEGEFSHEILKEAKVKGRPQMGTTRFEPNAIVLEFIYPEKAGSTTVLAVRIAAPERILFMPVPDWVVESIWQGEIDGSYHFESEAARMLSEYADMLEAESNGKWFGPRPAKRRE